MLSSSASSLIFAILPKCPACLVLLLAPLGIKLPGSPWFLAYVVIMLAAIPLVFFMTAACRKSIGLRSILIAMGGLLLMVVGRIIVDSAIVVACGVAAMFTASFLTARSAYAQAKGLGHACGPVLQKTAAR